MKRILLACLVLAAVESLVLGVSYYGTSKHLVRETEAYIADRGAMEALLSSCAAKGRCMGFQEISALSGDFTFFGLNCARFGRSYGDFLCPFKRSVSWVQGCKGRDCKEERIFFKTVVLSEPVLAFYRRFVPEEAIITEKAAVPPAMQVGAGG